MSSELSGSQQIARERARRQSLKEQQEDMSMSAQIQREIDRRKAERARCKARLKLVTSGGQQEENRESVKNREKG
jgi:hypothetical protein